MFLLTTTPHKTLLAGLLLISAVVLVSSDLTTPRRSIGYTYKTSTSKPADIVTLTAYLDLTCSDSKQAYPVLLDLADILKEKNFELVVRSFSLPYHRNSHVVTEAVHVVAQYTKGNGVFPFITAIYQNLSSLTTTATSQMTDSQVLDVITQIASKSSGIAPSTIKNEVTSFDGAARLDFKYGCTRGVYATPTFMVNDVVVSAPTSWTTKQWMDKIGPLLE